MAAVRLLQQLPPGVENIITRLLNDALLGREQYPVSMMIGGIVAGAITEGAGYLFAIASTAMSSAQKARRILARENDEIWQVEEIGKSKSTLFSGQNWDIVYVGSYFLVDPFRKKSWLIHEARSVVQA